MRSGIFAIYDNVAKIFHDPFMSPSKGAAERSFRDSIADPQSVAHRHPEDYDLFFIGTYDTESGSILPSEPELLVNGSPKNL